MDGLASTTEFPLPLRDDLECREDVTDLVLIFGPPAVGKMTVGAALSELTGWPLFHDHLTIEAVLPVFGFDHPAFWPIVLDFRARIFNDAIRHGLPGLIYTFAWTLDDPADLAYVHAL